MNRLITHIFATSTFLLMVFFQADAQGNTPEVIATKLSESSIGVELQPIPGNCGLRQALVRVLRTDLDTGEFETYSEVTYPDSRFIPDLVDLPPGEYEVYSEWCWDVTEDDDDGSDVDVVAQVQSDSILLFGLVVPDSLTCLPPTCTGIEGDSYYDLDGSFSLQWSAAAGAVTYDIQVATGPSFNNYSDVATNISSTTFPIPPVSSNGVYRYRVRSCEATSQCTEDWTEIDKDIVVNLVPSVPIGMSATHDFENLYVSWSAPASGSIAEYRLTETLPDSTENVTVHNSPGVTRAERGLGLYQYRVAACSRLNDPESCGPEAVASTTIAFTSCTVDQGSYSIQACAPIIRSQLSADTKRGGSRGANSAEVDYLLQQADGAFNVGAAFLCEENEDIFRSGLVNQTDPTWRETLIGSVDGLPTYDAEALTEAQGFYECALELDPGNANALIGLLNVNQARALKANLVADTLQRNQFVARYEVVVLPTGTQPEIVADEISLLDEAVDELNSGLVSILDLYADPASSGPGAILRGEIASPDAELLQTTIRTLLGTLSRIAQIESALSRVRVDQVFYIEAGLDSRRSILDDLEDALARLTTALQLVSPYVSETTFDLPDPDDISSTVVELTNQSAILEVSNSVAELAEMSNLLRQGYTPLGFVPDFVPFVSAENAVDNLRVFESMEQIALPAINSLRAIEASICGACDGNVGGILAQLRQLAATEGEFEARLNDLETTYEQRLRTLVGDVQLVDGSVVADIYTFLYPDVDLDGDGVTERDERRAELSLSGFNFSSGNKGQIGAQYGVITTAELRADDSLDQMNDVVERMELIEAESRELADLDLATAEYIFERVTQNGSQISLLIQQRGYIEQVAADRAARRAKRRGLLTSIVGIVAGAAGAAGESGNPSGLINAIGGFVNAVTSSSRSGSVAQQVALIDAQINDIRTLQQADIRIIEVDAAIQSRLIKASYNMYNLALSQNNLALSYAVAQRDIDREVNALGRQNAEVMALLTDLERTRAILQRNSDNQVVGWANVDIRDTLSDTLVRSDQALQRAKVWAYMALRALDYYANLPPDEISGQPEARLQTLYRRIYQARRSEELAFVMQRMRELALSDFEFAVGTTSCGSQSVLSLKNDVFATNSVFYDAVTGDETGTADSGVFEYYSSHEGRTFVDEEARLALFRDELRRNITGELDENGNLVNRKIDIRFSTNLLPPPPDTSEFRSRNPFYLKSAKTAKITGFVNPNCVTPASPGGTQGIKVDLRSESNLVDVTTLAQSSIPAITISQDGNSYLKHTGWDDEDFIDTAQTQLENPLENITVYTAYEQLFPSWFTGDIDGSGSSESHTTIGSDVQETIFGLVNGVPSQGMNTLALAFTDRAVANDSWRLLIEENDASNDEFFDALETMLSLPIDDPAHKFLTDIQIQIGWASRNTGGLQTTVPTE